MIPDKEESHVAKSAHHPYRVSIFVATIIIAWQNLTLQYVDVMKKYISPNWFALVFTAGLTSIIYKLVVYLYETVFWQWFNRDIVLAGKWKHTLSPVDQHPNNDRDGEFEIIQTAFETKIVGGMNFDQATRRRSHWRSVAVFDDELGDRSLWVIYQIERGQEKLVAGEAEIDRGLLRIHFDVDHRCGRVTKLYGNYWDAGRSQHKGSFEAELVEPSAFSLMIVMRGFLGRAPS
jgi:hypothetical protein